VRGGGGGGGEGRGRAGGGGRGVCGGALGGGGGGGRGGGGGAADGPAPAPPPAASTQWGEFEGEGDPPPAPTPAPAAAGGGGGFDLGALLSRADHIAACVRADTSSLLDASGALVGATPDGSLLAGPGAATPPGRRTGAGDPPRTPLGDVSDPLSLLGPGSIPGGTPGGTPAHAYASAVSTGLSGSGWRAAPGEASAPASPPGGGGGEWHVTPVKSRPREGPGRREGEPPGDGGGAGEGYDGSFFEALGPPLVARASPAKRGDARAPMRSKGARDRAGTGGDDEFGDFSGFSGL